MYIGAPPKSWPRSQPAIVGALDITDEVNSISEKAIGSSNPE
jgi:hypothetical protein